MFKREKLFHWISFSVRVRSLASPRDQNVQAQILSVEHLSHEIFFFVVLMRWSRIESLLGGVKADSVRREQGSVYDTGIVPWWLLNGYNQQKQSKLVIWARNKVCFISCFNHLPSRLPWSWGTSQAHAIQSQLCLGNQFVKITVTRRCMICAEEFRTQFIHCFVPKCGCNSVLANS